MPLMSRFAWSEPKWTAFSSIRIDDIGGACTAVQHLINLGHERIAIISGDPNEPEHFTAELQRREGYRAALKAAGLPIEAELEAHGTFTIEGGDEATVQLLGRRSLPTAIYAECDEMAVGALRALRRVGLRVPADVSVVGFDDHPMAQYFDLTTIAQDVRDQGRQIAPHGRRRGQTGRGATGEAPRPYSPGHAQHHSCPGDGPAAFITPAGCRRLYCGDDGDSNRRSVGQFASPVYTKKRRRHTA